MDRALVQRSAGDYEEAIRSLQAAVTADPVSVRARLLLAETLSWAKRFDEAEREYRTVLASERSHEATLGLARVLLWRGRYEEARRTFRQLQKDSGLDLDAAEGAATAAYWSGDFRTAQREFEVVLRRDPNREVARRSLAEIAGASAPYEHLGVDVVDDDQPFRALRASTAVSLFSDPLTRWDAAAGSWWLDASRAGIRARAPFLRIGNDTIFPAQRLAITASIGMMRYPDQTTRPVGSAAVSFLISGRSRLSAAIEQEEMLATATAIDRHIAARAAALQWKRQGEHTWFGAADARRIQYSDANRGWAVTGYAMAPVAKRGSIELSAGASFALRDTKESRFYVDSVSSRRVDSTFFYSYRGAYTPYWTPRAFREARGIVAADLDIRRAHLRFQADGGVTRDRATNFGPDAGITSLPGVIFPFEFRRTYHPLRLQLTLRTPVSRGLSLDTTVERTTTVFYKANAIRASLVRRR